MCCGGKHAEMSNVPYIFKKGFCSSKYLPEELSP